MAKILTWIVGAVAIVVAYSYYKFVAIPDLPEFDVDQWWGPGERRAVDTSVRSFKVEFSDKMIQDLRQRLKNRRPFTPTLEGIQSQYGINIDYLEKVLKYWENEYDFKKRQDLLNLYPRYITNIQGLDIQFIRAKPKDAKGKKVVPLLMLHGWPSSSKEFVKCIPFLTTPRKEYDFVFEVIAADLPGFGFSQGSTKPGFTVARMGVIMRNLMLRLGFDKFYIQAGDQGALAATHLATLFPESVLGYHTNLPLTFSPRHNFKLILGSLFPSLMDPVMAKRTYPLTDLFTYVLRESGYFHLQATKPDTVGVALTDSPAGLAGYIIEKMAVCSNSDQLDTPHGGIAELDLDDVLDTITIIWVNNCIVTSMRSYSEGFVTPEVLILQEIPTKVPTAGINFKYEVLYQSPSIVRNKYPNLVRWTVHEFGGHFAGLHTPEVLSDDVFASVVEFIKFNNSNKR